MAGGVRGSAWQNTADQSYRRLYGDNQFDEKRSHALQVCIYQPLNSQVCPARV